jgi:hypothetical protein
VGNLGKRSYVASQLWRIFTKEEQGVTRSIWRITGLIFMIAVSAMLGWSAEEQQNDKTASEAQREPMYQGKPLSYWMTSIRDRDERMVPAFDAIVDLGRTPGPRWKNSCESWLSPLRRSELEWTGRI